MRWVCGEGGGLQACVQTFGEEASWKTFTWKTQTGGGGGGGIKKKQ
jgi:hypothetical protein